MKTKNDRRDGRSANWSLKDEIKKRKTQQLIDELESRRAQAAKPAPSARPTQQFPMPKFDFLEPATPAVQKIRPRSRRWLFAAIAAVLTFVLVFGSFSLVLLARKPVTTPIPTPLVLSSSSASEAINYLKRVGLQVFDMRTFAVPNATWRATEEIQFSTQNQNGTATFLILSYDSASKAGIDAFSVHNGKKFDTWRLLLISNLLVLSSPDSASPVTAEVTNHLTYYLAGSSVPILPTVTLQLSTVTPTGTKNSQ